LIPNVLRVISYSQEYYENKQLKTHFSQTQLLAPQFKEQALEPCPLDCRIHAEEIRVIRNGDKDLGHGLKAFF
jgi:hypothetical protein